MCLAAVAAGLLAGVLISIVQHFTTTPLIIRAEESERTSLPGRDHHAPAAGAAVGSGVPAQHPGADHDHHSGASSQSELSPALERVLFTTLADVLIGIGFAFLVITALAWKAGANVRSWTGICCGAAGFVVFTLAPALGLAPELPGMFAPDLAARQLWWVGAAGSAAIGLGLLTFAQRAVIKALGIAIALVPHLIGAPVAEDVGGDVAPELASQFAATSIAVSALFWVLLGWLSDVFYRRFDETV